MHIFVKKEAQIALSCKKTRGDVHHAMQCSLYLVDCSSTKWRTMRQIWHKHCPLTLSKKMSP